MERPHAGGDVSKGEVHSEVRVIRQWFTDRGLQQPDTLSSRVYNSRIRSRDDRVCDLVSFLLEPYAGFTADYLCLARRPGVACERLSGDVYLVGSALSALSGAIQGSFRRFAYAVGIVSDTRHRQSPNLSPETVFIFGKRAVNGVHFLMWLERMYVWSDTLKRYGTPFATASQKFMWEWFSGALRERPTGLRDAVVSFTSGVLNRSTDSECTTALKTFMDSNKKDDNSVSLSVHIPCSLLVVLLGTLARLDDEQTESVRQALGALVSSRYKDRMTVGELVENSFLLTDTLMMVFAA